jgi:hypothetical protein
MHSRLIFFLIFCLCLSACAANLAQKQAENSLTLFFHYLSDEEYQKAAGLFGGSYENLQAMNPLIPPEDHEQLWQAGCKINGFQCLPILHVVRTEQTDEDNFLFIVEFRETTGDTLKVSACCGANENELQPASQFEYHVVKSGSQFLVQELPVYIP